MRQFLANMNWSAALPTIIGAVIAALSLWYTFKTNRRAEKLFGSQACPLIQEQPIRLAFDDTLAFGTTCLEIVNYSGFHAYDVSCDLKYGDNKWIVHWLRAERDRLQQLGARTIEETQQLNRLLAEPWRIHRIKAGKRITSVLTGSLSQDYVRSNTDGTEVLVRVRWKNRKGHAFDRIRKFNLVCTTVGTGMDFDFIPQEIVAKYE